MENATTYIEGIVEEIIYSNYANGYTVCTIDAGGEFVTATGYIPYLSEGESVKLTGAWINHPEYGRQFSASLYEKIQPTAAESILRYLSSGVLKGVRLATAKKIVDEFGDDSLLVILNEPQQLAKISGISKQKALAIGQEYAKQHGISSIIMFLQQYGIGAQTAIKVYRRFGYDAITYIKDDPYVLVDEINGISFKTVDRAAHSMGIEAHNLSRLKSGVKYVLEYNAQNSGHTYLPLNTLVQASCAMLGVKEEHIERALYSLDSENSITIKELDDTKGVFLTKMLDAELYICKKISHMTKMPGVMPKKEAEKLVDEWDQKSEFSLAPEQRSAVIFALSTGIMILTGGPGTGKTTIVNTIIEILQKKNISIALTAPTGRAAKRMSDVTGINAKTIHRLLEISYSEDENAKLFYRDETNPLDEDIIIVDETSMVDVVLGSALFKALKPTAHIIMVGDVDQLPPVGAGNMLGDIIDSGKVTTIRLTKIFRQAAKSMIVQNSHKIINGETPILNELDSDFYYISRSNADDIAECVTNLCQTRLPNAYGFDPMTQIQVLSSMKKGVCGVKNLNKLLQHRLNPPSKSKAERTGSENIFRVGDKIMQTKNNYDLVWELLDGSETGRGVFNGDMGFVENIDNVSRQMSVIYDDKRVVYSFDALDELELSYAITVHKSQGSEFDVVVMPVYNSAPMLMKRNLLYTALTRAKKFVVLVGVLGAIHIMVAGENENKRFTSIKKVLENENI